MMKRGLLTISLVGVALLAACGPSYDKEIKQVLEMENERLATSPNEANINELKRENTQIAVYKEGEYILVSYMIRPDYKADFIYESTDSGYEVNASSDLREKIKNMEPTYTENMEEDS